MKFDVSGEAMSATPLVQWIETIETFVAAFLAVWLGMTLRYLNVNRFGIARRQLQNFGLMIVWTALLYFGWPLWSRCLEAVPRIETSNVLSSNPYQETAILVISVVALDFVQYWLHRALHASRWLWWLHELHHSDEIVDASTGVRHYPLEPIVGAVIQGSVIVALGIPTVGVIAYAVLANTIAIIVHEDVELPKRVEAVARRFVVTPRMHRVHHIATVELQKVNLGVLFRWWDRLFGTYLEVEFTPAPQYGLAMLA